MNGNHRSLTKPGTPFSEIINSLIGKIRSEYNGFLKANESLSKGDYNAYFTDFQNEIELIESAGQQVNVLEARLISQLNSTQRILEQHRQRCKGHEKGKAIVSHIDKLLDMLSRIEAGIRQGTTAAVHREVVLGQLTRK